MFHVRDHKRLNKECSNMIVRSEQHIMNKINDLDCCSIDDNMNLSVIVSMHNQYIAKNQYISKNHFTLNELNGIHRDYMHFIEII